MKTVTAIVVDGVLRKPIGGTPIPEGIALYHGLCSASNVVLLRSETDDEAFEHFLVAEQLTTHGNVYPWPRTGGADDVTRAVQVNRLRLAGYGVDLVVEPDPGKAVILYRQGFNVLHFMHAQYARPDWRPDFEGGQRPWDELVEEERKSAKLRAADTRAGSAE